MYESPSVRGTLFSFFYFFSFNAKITAFTNVFMNCEKLPLHEFYCSIRSTALLKEQNQPRAKQAGRQA